MELKKNLVRTCKLEQYITFVTHSHSEKKNKEKEKGFLFVIRTSSMLILGSTLKLNYGISTETEVNNIFRQESEIINQNRDINSQLNQYSRTRKA